MLVRKIVVELLEAFTQLELQLLKFLPIHASFSCAMLFRTSRARWQSPQSGQHRLSGVHVLLLHRWRLT